MCWCKSFYKVSQGNNEKFPSFATRLEGSLNQIQLQCPRKNYGSGGPTAPAPLPFPWVKKYTHNSIWYLYGIPGMSYSQVMVAAHKAESKNKETWDRVRAKVTVTTKLVEGAAKLKQQFAKLMAALTQGVFGSGNTSAPSSP